MPTYVVTKDSVTGDCALMPFPCPVVVGAQAPLTIVNGILGFNYAAGFAGYGLTDAAGVPLAAGDDLVTPENLAAEIATLNAAIAAAAASGGAPSGAAGGALTGSYPNPGLSPAAVQAAITAGVSGASLAAKLAFLDCNNTAISSGASLATCANLAADAAATLAAAQAYTDAEIAAATAGGGAPSGPAAGILAGTYPNPSGFSAAGATAVNNAVTAARVNSLISAATVNGLVTATTVNGLIAADPDPVAAAIAGDASSVAALVTALNANGGVTATPSATFGDVVTTADNFLLNLAPGGNIAATTANYDPLAEGIPATAKGVLVRLRTYLSADGDQTSSAINICSLVQNGGTIGYARAITSGFGNPGSGSADNDGVTLLIANEPFDIVYQLTGTGTLGVFSSQLSASIVGYVSGV